VTLADAAVRLEQAARGRFVHWDGSLWLDIVNGPVGDLASGLDGAGAGIEAAPVVESFLRLACEAVGRGYLFPTSAGRESFFGLAFRVLVPVLVPRLPPERRAAAMAALWNLSENLEAGPVWLARIFYRVAWGWRSLDDLEAKVAEVERLASAPPDEGQRLGDRERALWIGLAEEDRRFLPGRLHFVAPTVLCVHDRSRAGVRVGVWLIDEPLVLGAMACDHEPGPEAAAGARWKKIASAERRFDEPHAAIANAWRAAASLVTSQKILALLPA
jgi:hypothetical protein